MTKELFQKYMPSPADDTFVMLCGPKPMNLFMFKTIIKNMNCDLPENFYKF